MNLRQQYKLNRKPALATKIHTHPASGFILVCRLTHLRMPYAVSVRQVSGLPPASFRSRLAADTLALGYVLGATPCTRDFHPLERAHAERTTQ